MELASDTIGWLVIDLILTLIAISGNLMTVIAIILYKKLSSLVSNYLVFNLALSDIMVGFTIPYHFFFSAGISLSSNKGTCILRFMLVILSCSSSIYNLLAIATDRYVAIVHPLHYNKYVTKNVASAVIIFGWIFTLACASTVLFWNNWSSETSCTLDHVVPREYLTFFLTPMFLSVWLGILLVYLRIWRVATKQARRIKEETHTESEGRDSKSVQVVMLVLGCFSICWLPYFIAINIQNIKGEISDVFYEITFTMAMANSCMNPLIYAWKYSNFREAFWCIIRCKQLQYVNQHNFVTNHTPIDNAMRATLSSNGKCETTSNHTEIEIYDTQSQVNSRDLDQENVNNGDIVTISSDTR